MMKLNELSQYLMPYQLVVDTFETLDGYTSENYKISSSDGDQYVFKFYRDAQQLAIIAAEVALIEYVQPKIDLHLTTAIKVNNQWLCLYEDGSFGRLMPFVEGKFWAESSQTPSLIQSFGEKTALLNIALASYYSSDIAARRLKWDIQYTLLSRKDLQHISNPHHRAIVQYFFMKYEQEILPKQSFLRHAMIHGDLNDWNVLTSGNVVTGVLDFGDSSYGPMINEVAVALTYLCMDKDDPINIAAHYIKAYHNILPLQSEEIDLLYYLIAARLCISLCSSAAAANEGEAKSYIYISERSAWVLLEKWLSINPEYAQRMWRKAISAEDLPIQNFAMQERRKKFFSRALSLSYSIPIHMTGAAFQYMYGDNGKTYLDAYNNIPHVGHTHPNVVEAICQQAARLNTNTRYHYDILGEYTERLLLHFPKSFTKVFLVNSGSEATDLAWRLVYAYRNRRQRVVLEHGYHGHTNQGIAVSAYKFDGKGGAGLPDHTTKLTLPNAYRGSFKYVHEYVRDAVQQFEQLDKSGIEIAAMVAEPISGCGGQVPLMSGYLPSIQVELKKREALLILDEVQTGFGRLGHYFWGFEMLEVMPDIIVLGKPIANGHPMGAVITTDEVVERFETGMEFFSSFGGNPVSCAAALAVLETIEEEKLVENARDVGDYWLSELRNIQLSDQRIGDVRGSGLFIGVEMVNPDDFKHDTILAQRIKNQMKDRGVLCSTDGPYDNVLKMKPPICFSRKDVDLFIHNFTEILSQ